MIYKATQTEYKGDVFRSKTEAIFARALVALGFDYDYEPIELIQPDRYIPDFSIYGIFATAAIEVKPKYPTDSYLKRLTINASNIVNRFGCGFYLVVINPWDNTVTVSVQSFSVRHQRWFDNPDMTITIKHSIEFAKKHRFDLENTCSASFLPDHLLESTLNPDSLYNRAMTAMLDHKERQRVAALFGELA